MATLDIAGAAGFGTTSVLTGTVTLGGDALLEFASGQITTIAAQSGLTLNGPDAFVADASNTSSNSALTGLTTITGGLNLEDITPLTTTGALTVTDLLQVDDGYLAGGSTLHIGGALTNDGSVDIGTGGLSAATTVTATAINNYVGTNLGTINLTGNTDTGLPIPVVATLDIAGAAGFGTASTLTGTVNLSGDALLEFASGQITTIAFDSGLTLNGPDAFVADASNTSSNSALTGLTRIVGGLNLEGIAPLTTTGALTVTDLLQVDDGYQSGGSTLHIGGELTNDGTVDIGTGGLTTATTVTATALNNSIGPALGTINLTGNNSGDLPVPVVATFDIASAAGFGPTSVVTGTVVISGDAVLEFASGQITTIAANSGLTLNGPDAFVADASNTSSNSALAGLTTITGGLNLEGIAPLTTTVALTVTDLLQVDDGYQSGGSTLHIGGALTNDGTVDIGTGGLSAATTVTATALNNYIGTNLGTINLTGNTSVEATLDITGAAGFGMASVLTGTVVISGDALLEFASGQITTIAANSGLTLNGPDAFVADASNTSSNSALSGLATITGGLNLQDIGTLTTTVAMTVTGNLDVDNGYQTGGSTLHIGGALTNDGAVSIGTDGLSAATTVTATGLDNAATGAIYLAGNGNSDFEALLTVSGSAVNDGAVNIDAFAEPRSPAAIPTTRRAARPTVAGRLDAGAIVVSGGTFELLGGATTSGPTTVKAGGTEEIGSGYSLNGATASTTVSSGGTLVVAAGGSVSNLTVSKGASVIVSSGGAAGTMVILSGGSETVEAGGVDHASVVLGRGRADRLRRDGHRDRARPAGRPRHRERHNRDVGGLEVVSSGGTAFSTLVSSGGSAVVSSGGTASGAAIRGGKLEVASGGKAGTVDFGSGGTLQLDTSQQFSGTVSGFAVPDQIDLRDIAYTSGATHLTWTQHTGSGTLAVTSGTHSATLTLDGTYISGEFHLATDGSGGTLVTDPPVTIVPAGGNQTIVAPSGAAIFDFAAEPLGHDTITGFNDAQDAVELNTHQAASYAALKADISNHNGSTLITLDASHSITLAGVAPNLLTANDFKFG